jgi:hypothetical protein
MKKIKIQSKDISIVKIETIKPNPNNRNKHSPEQIERLCEIIRYQGFRIPLVVSNQSGFLVCGHGRLEAAKKMGLAHVPVIYQDFEDAQQEYAAGVSDNSIGSWAELDLVGINADIGDLGPDFDLDLLGIKDFMMNANIQIPLEAEKITTQFIIAVECKNEQEMQKLFEELSERGFECKLIT